MSTNLKQPQEKRQAEQTVPITQTDFMGQLDIPASEIDLNHVARAINAKCMGKWIEGETGSKLYSDEVLPGTTLYGKCEMVEQPYIVHQFDTKIYTSNKAIEGFDEVVNESGSVPSSKSWMQEWDGDCIIFSASGIFRVHFGDYVEMWLLNESQPSTVITDQVEAVGKAYGHRYIYSLARLTGTGTRNRLSDEVAIELETGTSETLGTEKDYGECYWTAEITETVPAIATAPVIYNLVCPLTVYGMTHFPLYRTKNIGRNTDPPGIDPVNGIGNNDQLYAWVDDVPVCKVFTASITSNTMTISQGEQLVKGDTGSVVTFLDGSTRTINVWTNGTTATMSAGADVSSQAASIGGGRLFVGYQTGNAIVRTSGASFVAADAGKRIYWSDGEYSFIKTRTDANNCTPVYVDGSNEDHGSLAAQIPFVMHNTSTQAFTRKWCDTIRDEGASVGLVGLSERINSGKALYQPRRFHRKLPAGNMGMVDAGFMVVGNRDDSELYYSQFGDKEYCLGAYRPDIQKIRCVNPIRLIVKMNAMAILLMPSKTYGLPLNVAANVGNSAIGEALYKLQEPNLIDDNTGVIAWQSVKHKNAGILIAVTNPVAVRTFNGLQWLAENLAVAETGDSAVQKYLEKIDPAYNVNASYARGSGYRLWFTVWEV